MHDKKKCKTCQYSAQLSGGDHKTVICYYSVVSGNGSCLKREGCKIVDQRGNDPKHCLLYVKGERIMPPSLWQGGRG